MNKLSIIMIGLFLLAPPLMAHAKPKNIRYSTPEKVGKKRKVRKVRRLKRRVNKKKRATSKRKFRSSALKEKKRPTKSKGNSLKVRKNDKIRLLWIQTIIIEDQLMQSRIRKR